ncbi:MAG TPA: hypothetical protein VFX35_01660, partial [Solirubrobacterales bacterium]|nr:hypothetical protein [Solirubrobacterales bacterium]
AAVVLGVDGARFRDGFAIVGTEIASGFQWNVGIWERPLDADPDYEHPVNEIDAAMSEAMDRFNVQRVYIDPQWIDHLLTLWTQRWGELIFKWETHRNRPMATAVANFASALKAGDLSHDGDETLAQHIGNARRKSLKILGDADGKPLWVIEKERSDSPKKMDGAMAAVISWQARGDTMSTAPPSEPLVAFL